MLINRFPQHTVFATVEAAEAIAHANNADDEDGWIYATIVDPNGTGKAIVAVYDETGEFLGNL